MKSLIRWSATVGLVGITLLGSMWIGTTQVLALPQEQIVQKLRSVPVFTITDGRGSLLVLAPPNGQKGGPIAGIFISQKDAQAFLDREKTRNPQLKDVQVSLVSLAQVYEFYQSNKGKPDQLSFTIVPSKQQSDAANALLKQNGKQAQPFNGTPLFVMASQDGAKEGFLVVQRGNQAAVPMFFNKEELQAFMDQLKKQQSDQFKNVKIQVFSLEGLIAEMQRKPDKDTAGNDEFLSKVQLVPSRESLEYVRSVTGKQQNQGRPQIAPANKPATPVKPAPKQ
ncbi:MAG: hypothetical protein HC866_00130 [Leptolyngbyaceae cyanobacterium RU_5_1]|nr:hypothetical protein [Leptolyngbyaceae cyanobacterium RU_5_1]